MISQNIKTRSLYKVGGYTGAQTCSDIVNWNDCNNKQGCSWRNDKCSISSDLETSTQGGFNSRNKQKKSQKKNIRKLRKILSKKRLMGGFIRGGVDQFATSTGAQTSNNEIFNKCNY
jgi:hypothetical protein